MKKFAVTWISRLNDWTNWTDSRIFGDMMEIKAETKEDAIRAFLLAKFEFAWQPDLCEQFWDFFLGVVFYREVEKFIHLFSAFEKVRQIADEIYCEFHFAEYDDYPEKYISQCNFGDYENSFYSLLTEEDKKALYFQCNENDVFCVKLEPRGAYIKRKRKDKKNILYDINDKDIFLLNCLSEMIRCEKKEWYYLDESILLEYGVEDSDTAQELLRYCSTSEFSTIVHTETDTINTDIPLISMKVNDFVNMHLYIKPLKLLFDLAEAGYDFTDRINEISQSVLREHLKEMKDLQYDYTN